MEKADAATPHVVRVDPDDVRVIRYCGEDALEGLWVELRALKTGRQVQALLSRTYWVDLLPYLAPHVVAWNLTGETLTERTLPKIGQVPERTVQDITIGPVPPPAEGGVGSFQAITVDGVEPTDVWEWIRASLAGSPFFREDDEGKAARPSGATPDGTPSGSGDGATETPNLETVAKRRRNRGS